MHLDAFLCVTVRRYVRGDGRGVDILVALLFKEFDGKFLNGGFGYFCHF